MRLSAGAVNVVWSGQTALFALADGEIVRCAPGRGEERVSAHGGGLLCAALAPDGKALLTGGDDGRIMLTPIDGEPALFAALGRKWIDHLIASPASGVIIAAQGKVAHIFKPGANAPAHHFTFPSSIGGLAFDAKGRRFAASHYGGASVHYALISDDRGARFAWSGSHLAVTLAPDGDFLITAMQENGLHGWRTADKLDLRMTGYPAKTRSFSWDRRGRQLATSGANPAVIWPFAGKLGPQGKAPLTVGERSSLVTCVAFHPREDVLAIGYADGAAFAVTLDMARVLDLAAPSGAPVTALSWRGDGAFIALSDEAGAAALCATPSS